MSVMKIKDILDNDVSQVKKKLGIDSYTWGEHSEKLAEALDGVSKSTITRFIEDGSDSDVIAEAVKDATKIGDNAFIGTGITKAEFPQAENVGNWAFQNCTALTSVSLPKATTIERGAFVENTNLTSVGLPQVTTIEQLAFYGCTSLKNVELPMLTALPNSDFNYGAFQGCTSLESVVLPALTELGSSTFSECSNLKTVNIPLADVGQGEYSANSGQFSNCSSLEEIEIPSVTNISSSMFFACTSLKSVNAPKATIIGYNAFCNCSSLTSIDFPSVTEISNISLIGCTGLKSINLPMLTSIPREAFQELTSLEVANLPMVESMGNCPFRGCSALKRLTIGKITTTSYGFLFGTSVTTSALEIISFPSVTNVNGISFSSGSSAGSTAYNNLSTVYLLSATQIDYEAFENCSALTAIVLGNTTAVCTLSNKNAFEYTPIASGTGYIYVPSALIDSYKTATNWSTYANQFRALEDYTVDGTTTGELDSSKI